MQRPLQATPVSFENLATVSLPRLFCTTKERKRRFVKYIFADTGYWVALLNPGDNLHPKAASLSRSLQPCHIVTTEMVLVEVLNDFPKRGDYLRDAAARFIQNLYQHSNTTIIEQTSIQFKEALELYIQRKDKAWSQTDCVSFNIMPEYSLVEALAYDRHFVQAGFQPLMRNCQH